MIKGFPCLMVYSSFELTPPQLFIFFCLQSWLNIIPETHLCAHSVFFAQYHNAVSYILIKRYYLPIKVTIWCNSPGCPKSGQKSTFIWRFKKQHHPQVEVCAKEKQHVFPHFTCMGLASFCCWFKLPLRSLLIHSWTRHWL